MVNPMDLATAIKIALAAFAGSLVLSLLIYLAMDHQHGRALWANLKAKVSEIHSYFKGNKPGELCPKCGEKTSYLFGPGGFRAAALAAVDPQEAREIAKQVRICVWETYPYSPIGDSKAEFFCPKCKKWTLKCADSANEGTGFTCQNPQCGFNFGVMN